MNWLSKINRHQGLAQMALAALLLLTAWMPETALAQSFDIGSGSGGKAPKWSLSLETMALLTSLSFIPAAILMMSAFTRIIIVLGLLRTAIGTTTTPPNQVLIGIALLMTFFIMKPVVDDVYTQAWKPLSKGSISFPDAAEKASVPVREFMLANTRQTDIAAFATIAKVKEMKGPEDLPFHVLMASFVTSELKTAFQIGFTIFIPFIIIDLVVASVLMALGMMMVPPSTVSLPFKLMLFVMIDGWTLLLTSLSASFRT